MAHRLIRKFHFVVLALCQFTKKSESLRNLNEMEHAILPISSVKCKCPPIADSCTEKNWMFVALSVNTIVKLLSIPCVVLSLLSDQRQLLTDRCKCQPDSLH